MLVSSKSRYALRALVELELCSNDAKPAAPVRVCDLAARGDLPEQYLEQVFATLRRAGMLRSHRGAGGGFTFARRPDRVSVLDVVTALDGPSAARARGDEHCGFEDGCCVAAVWHEAEAAFERVLAACTIADLAERERSQGHAQLTYEI
jgi:Rrf2 family protein